MPVGRRDTKEAILAAATELFEEQGYAATGVNAVTSRAGVPKGSFYHFFPSKQALALEVLARYRAAVDAELEEALGRRGGTPFERLGRFFEGWAARLEEKGWRGGCLAGILGQELGAREEPLRAALDAAFRSWTDRIAACLTELGGVETPEHARIHATFLLASWEGALLRMRVARGPDPLTAFFAVLF